MRIGAALDQTCRFFDSVGKSTVRNWNTQQFTAGLVIFNYPEAKRRRVYCAREKGLIAQGIDVRNQKRLLN